MIGYSSGLKSITERLTSTNWINREQSELNNTEISATLWRNGRRQKKCSAICPNNARELLSVLRYVLKRSKHCLRHPFNYCET